MLVLRQRLVDNLWISRSLTERLHNITTALALALRAHHHITTALRSAPSAQSQMRMRSIMRMRIIRI